MLTQILNDGWRIVPFDKPTEFGLYHEKQRFLRWQVIGPDDKAYSAPLAKRKALAELKKQWQQWKALQK